MKKLTALLLGVLLTGSLISCDPINQKPLENTEPTPTVQTPETGGGDTTTSDFSQKLNANKKAYGEVMDAYRTAVKATPFYYVNSGSGKAATSNGRAESSSFFDLILSSALYYYPGVTAAYPQSPMHTLSFGYAFKDLNADGVDELVLLTDSYQIIAIYTLVNGQPMLVDPYFYGNSYWIDDKGLIHAQENTTDKHLHSHSVFELSSGSASLKMIAKFGSDGSIGGTDTFTFGFNYYEMSNGTAVLISADRYWELTAQYQVDGKYSGPSATKDYANLPYLPLFSENDIAIDMCEAAASDRIPIILPPDGAQFDITSFRTYIYRINNYSYNVTVNGRADWDIDGDGKKEMILSVNTSRQIDTIVLKYDSGKVYVKGFYFRNLYSLHTDGSFYWNHTGAEGLTYGSSKLVFQNGTLSEVELWRVVDGGTANAKFYIDGKSVSEEDLFRYFDQNPKVEVEFFPYQLSFTVVGEK